MKGLKMCRSLFIAFLCLFLIIPAFSQVESQVKSGAGLKLGLSNSNMYGDDKADNTESLSGLAFSGFATLQMSDYFAFNPEFKYVQRGVIFENSSGDYHLSLDYIELPLLFKITIPTNSIITPNVFFGPTGSLKINEGYDEDELSDARKIYRDYDAGITFGLGSDFEISESGSIVFDLSFYYGVIKNTFFDNIKYKDHWDIKNNSIAFNLGYKFNI